MTREPVQFRIDDDVQLMADRWPGTGPPVVLLHSGVCDRRSWFSTADELQRAGCGPIVAYDRRAYGETPVSVKPFLHLDDLIAVLDQSFDEPAWLVGSSMGGGLALDTALRHPDRLAGLVLLAPAISGAPPPDVVDPGSRRLDALMDAADAAGDYAGVNRYETSLWLDGPAGPEGRVQGPARDLALAMNAIVLANETAEHTGNSDVEVWPVLEKLQLPVTVAWGDLDLPHLIESGQVLADRLPVSRRRILPGTAHLPYLDRPELVVSLIREALAFTA